MTYSLALENALILALARLFLSQFKNYLLYFTMETIKERGMGYGGREKRRYPRIEHHYIIRFREIKPGGSPAERDVTSVRNISKCGVLFYSSSPFEPGAELEISMRVHPLSKESIFWGKVVRCKPRPGAKGSYEVAVDITKMDEATRSTFDRAIKFFTFNEPSSRL